jgi:hypothetical protein
MSTGCDGRDRGEHHVSGMWRLYPMTRWLDQKIEIYNKGGLQNISLHQKNGIRIRNRLIIENRMLLEHCAEDFKIFFA